MSGQPCRGRWSDTDTRPMNVSVLGMGAWGRALAGHLARRHPVCWWGRTTTGDHPRTKSENLETCDRLEDCVQSADWLVLAVPVAALAEVASSLGDTDARLVWTCKGLEPERLRGPAQILEETRGPDARIAGLSGPSFAQEVECGQPTAVVAVSADEALAHECAALFHHDCMRVYASTDVAGVQAGGALKNVLAIASGIASGLGLGDNARAALITRGLHEMVTLGTSLGARPETLFGLSGLGDLVLTCTGKSSRNFRFGELVGSGSSCDEARAEIARTVEGLDTARAVRRWSAEHDLDLPICRQVAEVLDGTTSPADAVASLLAREAKTE